MDPKQRRQRVTLGALAVVLLAVIAWQFRSAAGPGPSTGGSARTAAQQAAAGRRTQAAPVNPVDVRLEALEGEHPPPAEVERNPFRFRPSAPPPDEAPHPAPPRSGPLAAGPMSGPDPAAGPPVPPPPPPIPLKFIGVVSSASTRGKVAVLSDGRFVYHGREGDIIDGRYRVVKIGEESIQMEYFDGRGRQTIRLSGS